MNYCLIAESGCWPIFWSPNSLFFVHFCLQLSKHALGTETVWSVQDPALHLPEACAFSGRRLIPRRRPVECADIVKRNSIFILRRSEMPQTLTHPATLAFFSAWTGPGWTKVWSRTWLSRGSGKKQFLKNWLFEQPFNIWKSVCWIAFDRWKPVL